MMTFDYYDNAAHDMAADTKTAAQGLYDQLAKLYPTKTSAQLWGMVGITEMIGVDDFGPAETFTLANARTVYDWAVSKGINTLSFWALQRDNGGCAGGAAADNCSGIQQNTSNSHIFAPFTSGTTTPADDFSVTTTPAAATVTAGASTSATVKTAVTAGTAQTVNLTVGGMPCRCHRHAQPRLGDGRRLLDPHREHHGGHGLRHLPARGERSEPVGRTRGGPLPDRHRWRHAVHGGPVGVLQRVHRRPAGLAQGPHLEGQAVDDRRGARHHRRVGRLAGPRRLLNPARHPTGARHEAGPSGVSRPDRRDAL
ncbi:hypothetical protein STANM309S_03618 [Streptomyces tanashiensis]